MDPTRISEKELDGRRYVALDIETRTPDGEPAMAYTVENPSTTNDTGVEKKPKQVPYRHRHLFVEGSINETIVSQIMETLPKGLDAEYLGPEIASRLGWPRTEEAVAAIRRRVARWEGRRDKRTRMPTHIKVAATTIALIDAVAVEFVKPRADKTVGQVVKDWVAKVGDEVKAAMA
jgi:hypothetical protein